MSKYTHWYYTDTANFECIIEAEKGSLCQIRDEKGGYEPDYADEIYVTEVYHKDVDIIEFIHPDVLRDIVSQFVEVNSSI